MYYHGTSSAIIKDSYVLLPPIYTGVLVEKSRKKNLGKVFFTADIKSADIYAGRACNVFGGKPIILRVIPMGDVECLNDTQGTSVFHAAWAFVEILSNNNKHFEKGNN